jgi:hypothetical protein
MASVLIEGVQIVPAFAGVVADMDTDQTGDYVSLKNYNKCGILFIKAAGTGGDDPTISLLQAKDVAGTDAKVLNAIDKYWTKQAATNLTAVGTFTKNTQTADDQIAFNATSAEQVLIAYCEIDATDLDVANGFDCVRVDVALAASGGAQQGAVLYLLLEPRYSQAVALSAIAD